MNGFDLDGLATFLTRRADDIIGLVLDHAVVVLVSLALAMIIGVGIGLLVWDRPIARSVAITAAAVALTVPSLALLALLSPVLGLGWLPTIVALVFYSLLPIVRNTVVGLRDVPVAVLEAARGVGMGPLRIRVGSRVAPSEELVAAYEVVGTRYEHVIPRVRSLFDGSP